MAFDPPSGCSSLSLKLPIVKVGFFQYHFSDLLSTLYSRFKGLRNAHMIPEIPAKGSAYSHESTQYIKQISGLLKCSVKTLRSSSSSYDMVQAQGADLSDADLKGADFSLANVTKAVERGQLLKLPFTTTFDYLQMLQLIALSTKSLRPLDKEVFISRCACSIFNVKYLSINVSAKVNTVPCGELYVFRSGKRPTTYARLVHHKGRQHICDKSVAEEQQKKIFCRLKKEVLSQIRCKSRTYIVIVDLHNQDKAVIVADLLQINDRPSLSLICTIKICYWSAYMAFVNVLLPIINRSKYVADQPTWTLTISSLLVKEKFIDFLLLKSQRFSTSCSDGIAVLSRIIFSVARQFLLSSS
ncbi:hypothetical protein Syun_012628 [Stephania yunnanensis]|uniref:Uncharacterized protein n=1 Tax=Stephania yunnanensis TaxID=152371 RepID=A0AAP0PFI7_9MAGN